MKVVTPHPIPHSRRVSNATNPPSAKPIEQTNKQMNQKVGKSSTCLGLLGTLLRQPGLSSSDLAYIKPATQCEKPQLVTDWCEANGIACRGIGPVVFYKVRRVKTWRRGLREVVWVGKVEGGGGTVDGG